MDEAAGPDEREPRHQAGRPGGLPTFTQDVAMPPSAPASPEHRPSYGPAFGVPSLPPDPKLPRGTDAPPPGLPGRPDRGRRLGTGIAAAGVALVAAAVISLVFRLAGDHPDRSGGCGIGGCVASSASSVVGLRLRYRTVERDTGYFEGTVALVNAGNRPLTAWTLAFTYPGADIHNVWEAVLRRKGRDVVIASAPTAAAIAPGASFEVRFGGSGRPAAPTGCRLNGTPCTFIP